MPPGDQWACWFVGSFFLLQNPPLGSLFHKYWGRFSGFVELRGHFFDIWVSRGRLSTCLVPDGGLLAQKYSNLAFHKFPFVFILVYLSEQKGGMFNVISVHMCSITFFNVFKCFCDHLSKVFEQLFCDFSER